MDTKVLLLLFSCFLKSLRRGKIISYIAMIWLVKGAFLPPRNGARTIPWIKENYDGKPRGFEIRGCLDPWDSGWSTLWIVQTLPEAPFRWGCCLNCKGHPGESHGEETARQPEHSLPQTSHGREREKRIYRPIYAILLVYFWVFRFSGKQEM